MNVATPLLSVLAAGISGSARLREKLGNGEAAWAIDRCMKRIGRAIEAFEGSIVKTDADEIIATFDTVDASLQAAIEMQQRVADLPPVSGVKTAIRVGISCGQINGASRTIGDEVIKEAALLAGLAKPGQTLASKKINGLISATLISRVSDYRSTLVSNSGSQESVMEVSIHENASPRPGSLGRETIHDLESSDFSRKGCLRLTYFGETVLLNDSKTTIRMGRDSRCDIAIRDRRASRHHATIERRGDFITLIDQSANGTYVAIDGMTEQFLRHTECVLHGRGVISFGTSSADTDADLVEFELN